MLKEQIPIVGFLKPKPLKFSLLAIITILVAISCSSSLLTANADSSGSNDVYNDATNNNNNSSIQHKHPVYFSEYKLRSLIEVAQAELRQLKRDFVSHMTDIYFAMKSEPSIVRAEETELTGGGDGRRRSAAVLAFNMMTEQFGDLVIKRHIIQRRLLAGLKVAFVKFLPLRTIKRLMEKFPSYAWLKGQSQVDLRPKFPEEKDLRARLRAADDISTLTSDNMRRILRTIQWFLIERKYEQGSVDSSELYAMSKYANKMANFYLDQVIAHEDELKKSYDLHRQGARKLFAIAGGEQEFWRFVDSVIDSEALDIHLNTEANSLEAPPTINEQMIDNIERKWIPKRVLESIYEDRSRLLQDKAEIRHLIKLNEETSEIDLSSWLKKTLMYLSKINF